MAQRLPTVSGDSGAWGTVLNSYLGLALGVDAALYINVKDPTYGALGNDSHDDTVAIQAAINASVIAVDKTIPVYFPPGIYKITDQLTIPSNDGIRLIGSGMYCTVLKQYTSAKPILNCIQVGTSNLSPPMHSLEVKDIGLRYSVNQTSTASVAVYYNFSAPSTSGTAFYHHLFDRVLVNGAYTAWGCNTSTGPFAIWDTTWRGCWVENVYQSAFDMVAGSNTGQPSLRFYDCYVQNPGVTNHGPIFNFEAVNEAIICGCDLENWHGNILTADNSQVTITGLHLENNILDSVDTRQFVITNGTLSIDGFTGTNSATTAACTGSANLVYLGVYGKATVKNGYTAYDLSLGPPANKDLIFATQANGSWIRTENLIAYGGFINPGDAGTNAGVLSSIADGYWNLAFTTTPVYGFDGSIFPVGVYRSDIPNGTAFSIGTPTNMAIGRKLSYWIKNTSGGTLGAVNWGTVFLLPGGTFTRPSNGKSTTLTFMWSGTNFIPLGAQSPEF